MSEEKPAAEGVEIELQKTEEAGNTLTGDFLNIYVRMPDNADTRKLVNMSRLCGCRRVCIATYPIEGEED